MSRQSMFPSKPASDSSEPVRPDLSAFQPRAPMPKVDVRTLDAVSDAAGFPSRQSASERRGRKPSGRTGQIHPKLLPEAAEKIQAECTRRGIQQGVLIEEMLALYEDRFGTIGN